ncbi:type II toxin-antitoxin system ParD family antitoxin [Rhodanobacter sp. 115]|uniref:ribbon-helix-helix domain-containing protein n=1 Tax=Rhodanobacter sp. FW021-MT20 TaxID=1162282 RepID=UPI000260F4BB|nr:hypothetical protein [Rhodanobacter sp. 115]EIL94389.1 hypothetical protein UU5_12088 [Rhodanobacter sp. 115]
MATMNVSQSDELKQFTDTQAVTPSCGSSEEYLRECVRKQHAVERPRTTLLDGLNSGLGQVADDAFFAE